MIHQYVGEEGSQAHWGVSRCTANREILVQVANHDGDWSRLPLTPVQALEFADRLAAEAKQLLRQPSQN